jgi:hypothetical protein
MVLLDRKGIASYGEAFNIQGKRVQYTVRSAVGAVARTEE